MKQCIIIPTYWSMQGIESWKTFDHPTPIAESGTIGGTLANLAEMNFGVPVVLFPAPTDAKIESRVRELAAPHKLDLHVFSGDELERVRTLFADAGFPSDLVPDLHMNSYGAIRNMGLIFAALKGYDFVVQIDDDEIIEQRDFFDIAASPLGTKIGGDIVWGTTGFYRDKNDNVFYDGQAAFTFKNWPKDELFNEAVKRNWQQPARLGACIEAHGGAMVIHRNMFTAVPYDPYGTRGEDDDYAINALHKGLKYFFDRDLWVRHVPPERKGAFWSRQRQDIIRFKYLREKVRLMKLAPDALGVFIGAFVRDDLEYRAVSSCVDAALQFVDRDRAEFGEFLNNAVLAVELSQIEMSARADRFLRFTDAWSRVMPKLLGAWK